MIDWAAWQMAVSLTQSTGKPIFASGKYYINRAIVVSKTSYNMIIVGNYATITTTNNNPFSVFYRQQPTDNTEALNILVNAHFKISDLTIVGTWNQKGIDLGASYGAYYENVRFDGLGTGLHLRLALIYQIR